MSLTPNSSITLSDYALKAGESSTVTITFNSYVYLDIEAVTATAGTLSNLHSTDEGLTWIATLTPTTNTTAATNVITVDNTTVGGNSSSTSANYAVDTQAPTTTSVLIDHTTIKAGDTAVITATFSEAVVGLTDASITANGGTVSGMASDDGGLTWHATFTPLDNATASNQIPQLNMSGITDLAGNPLSTLGGYNQYSVDTQHPTAAISMTDTALVAGDTSTVNIHFSESVTGFTLADLTADHGTLTNLAAVGNSTSDYTATFTPDLGVTSATNTITLDINGVTDTAGNTVANSVTAPTYSVNTVVPSATITLNDGALKIGDTATVTITFNEPVYGFSLADVSASNGTLTNLVAQDEGLTTWTATLTPNAGVTAATNVITLDNTGVVNYDENAGVGVSTSGNYTVDTVAPAALITLSDTNLTGSDTATVTIAFTEAVTGLTNANVTAPHGSLSTLASADGGVTWTATFTPDHGVVTSPMGYNQISLNPSSNVTDLAGNVAMGASSGYYTIDTAGPTATITMSDTALTRGETATVTITFSESITNLTVADLHADHGTLSGLVTHDEGITWTATFTPTASTSASTNAITLDNTAISDTIGNAGTGTTTSANYTVNTRPAVVTPPVDSTLVDGTTVQTSTTTGADGSTQQVVTIPTVVDTRTNTDGATNVADIPLVKAADGHMVLSVGVPAGYGVQANGSATAQHTSDALTTLIAEIKAHTASGSNVQQTMVSGGSDFLGKLAASDSLVVQTITVHATAGTDTVNTPLVISGTAHVDGAAQTALVIDGSALPPGSAIQLQNVEFATLIGALHVTGGDGQQVVFGDGAAQYIVLGADDDVLHGGDGDDTVGSEGGNDHIYGDAGNDLVFGGAGNDTIDGGTGYDTLQLVGSGRADYTLRVQDGALVVTQRDGGIDGSDVVTNVEALRFTGVKPSLDAADTLTRLYDTVFDRTADQGGKDFWVAQSKAGMSMHDIAKYILASNESLSGGTLDNGAFVDAVYHNALDRTVDTAGRAFWVSQLDNGTVDRATLALTIANSSEKLALEAATPVTIDFNKTDVASIVRLYDEAYHRAPDAAGLNFWIAESESGMSLSHIAAGMLESSEGKQAYASLSNDAYVAALYTNGLERTASADEVHAWSHLLDTGAATRADVMLAIADSAEHVALVGSITTSIATV